jgi:hypothetical protein
MNNTLEEYKNKALKHLDQFKADNNFEMDIQEKACYTKQDCYSLIKLATNDTQVDLALNIFNRFKNYL